MFAWVVADDGVYAQNWIQLSQRINACNTVLCACLSKVWCHTMHLVSIVRLESTISPEFFRAQCKLPNQTKRTENMKISVVFLAESSLRSRIYKSSSLFKRRTVPFSHKMQIYNSRFNSVRLQLSNLQVVKYRCS